jgi:hypothetical protein
MSIQLDLFLDNYNVAITVISEDVVPVITDLETSLKSLTNPREIVSSIESVVGVEATIVKNPQTDEILLSSSLLSPEE